MKGLGACALLCSSLALMVPPSLINRIPKCMLCYIVEFISNPDAQKVKTQMRVRLRDTVTRFNFHSQGNQYQNSV